MGLTSIDLNKYEKATAETVGKVGLRLKLLDTDETKGVWIYFSKKKQRDIKDSVEDDVVWKPSVRISTDSEDYEDMVAKWFDDAAKDPGFRAAIGAICKEAVSHGFNIGDNMALAKDWLCSCSKSQRKEALSNFTKRWMNRNVAQFKRYKRY